VESLAPAESLDLSPLGISRPALVEFCRRWKMLELSLFGSALRPDFRPDSDVDFLVSFEEGAAWTLIDHAQMEVELVQLFGREVDLVSRAAVERSSNWIRRREILSTAQTVYAA
jgi:predicted nucleotidyltransferase